jgi:ketosteroid isomerase-like protein
MTDLTTLAAKDEIGACIYRLFTATDQRDWPAVRECFAELVLLDMTSLAGGAPTTVTPANIADAWEAGLKPIEHVHHQAGNLQIVVHGDTASAFCYGIALHYRSTTLGQNVRRFVGSYNFGLERGSRGWVISSFKFNLKFVDGNMELETAP